MGKFGLRGFDIVEVFDPQSHKKAIWVEGWEVWKMVVGDEGFKMVVGNEGFRKFEGG